MAYNTSFTRFKSTQLSRLDCGSYLKIARQDNNTRYFASFVAADAIEAGKCIAMIRVPAGTTVVGGSVAFSALGSGVVVALGDPFACGRLIGPLLGTNPSNNLFTQAGSQCVPYHMVRTGSVGDGCGIGYTYTCETDIILTNLYGAESSNQGGWAGGAGASSAGSTSGVIASGSRITVVLDVLPV